MKRPLISVVTPTLNAEATIERAILSVANQGYDPIEHWIIDGGSSDATLQIVEVLQARFPHIHVRFGPDRGIYDAMNRGLDTVAGDWIYFLGADDELYSNTVFKELYEEGYLALDGLLHGDVMVVGDGSWARDGTVYDGKFDLEKLFKKNICHQAILYPSALMRRVGYFKQKYFVSADWEYNIRCAACCDLIYVNKIIAKFASGGLSSTGDGDCFGTHLQSIVQKHFVYRDSAICRAPPETLENSAPRLLWTDDRPVRTCDDLLHELFGRPITHEIRTLFVVGAHQFQERQLFHRLFRNLEKVYLFEPLPQAIEELTRVVEGDPMVEVFGYAISDENGRAVFHVTDNNGESSSLLPMREHTRIFPWVHESGLIDLEVHTLDDVIDRHGLRVPDLLFLDVQGAEYRILSSLSPQLRASIKVIYTECSKEEVYRGAGLLEDIQRFLSPDFIYLGFAPLVRNSPTHGNAIFVHRHYAHAMERDFTSLPTGSSMPARGALPPPGRNAPCPCGSGRKYKYCHGQLG